jgi:type 1 glutamine amidotransferase
VSDNTFANFNLIKEADLLFLSVRRRTPQKEMMALIHAHLNAGKPLVGIRTASHAFDAKSADAQHEGWSSFDTEILGCNYQGHYNNGGPNTAPTSVRIIPGTHPILTGMPTNELNVTASLYKSRAPATTVTSLMTGRVAGGAEIEPVAWVNTAGNRRVFYTSLGSPDEFKQPLFRQLLLNGICWALDRPIPPRWISRAGSIGDAPQTK